jgi:hypothetical protein
MQRADKQCIVPFFRIFFPDTAVIKKMRIIASRFVSAIWDLSAQILYDQNSDRRNLFPTFVAVAIRRE